MSRPATPPEQREVAAPRNGLGTVGFVLGLIGLVFACFPFAVTVTWPPAVLGLVFSGIGLSRARSGWATNRRITVAGVIMSVISLLLCAIWTFTGTQHAHDQATKPLTISYSVTGNAGNVIVTYSTFTNRVESETETEATLPWHKTFQTTGPATTGQLVATTAPGSGTVTCQVTVNGTTRTSATKSGLDATATCDF